MVRSSRVHQRSWFGVSFWQIGFAILFQHERSVDGPSVSASRGGGSVKNSIPATDLQLRRASAPPLCCNGAAIAAHDASCFLNVEC